MLALARPETVQAIVDGGHLEWTAEALKKPLLEKARLRTSNGLEAESIVSAMTNCTTLKKSRPKRFIMKKYFEICQRNFLR